MLTVWLSCLLAFAAARSEPISASLTTSEKQDLRAEARLVIELLQNLHYSDRQFHEIESREIIARFLASLDPDNLILTKDELDFLNRRFGHSLKTVYLLKGDLQPAFEMFDFFVTRARRRIDWVDARLDRELDLTAEGDTTISSEPAADAAEADRRWELRLKSAVIAARLEGRGPADAVEHVREAYRRWGRELATMDALAVRERFFDDLIGLFDPHSGYFSPEHAHEFESMLRLAAGGVGIEVRRDDGRFLVNVVIPGSPAEAQGDLQAGDELLGLAEGDAPWRTLARQSTSDVSALLHGATGVTLRIAFRHAGGERREIALERKALVLAADRARGGVCTVPADDGKPRRIGWIELPDFYVSADPDGPSASRDVRELIDAMKTKGLDALVIDLRKNPGGALSEAVSLTGLFVPSGPVAYTRGIDGRINEEKIAPGTPVFSGPMVLLTSGESASASELFAGALQFHRRAIVVGEAATFGKGTAQDYIDLNKLPAHPPGGELAWGTLRVTRQRFYFPDGRSPQRLGAASDIVLPLSGNPDVRREADMPHALPSDTVTADASRRSDGDFARATEALLAELKHTATRRFDTLPEFSLAKRRDTLIAASAASSKHPSVQLEHRRNDQTAMEASIHSLRREIRALAMTTAYPGERYDLAAVIAVHRTHIENARAHRRPDAVPGAGWLSGGTFFLEDGGELRELALDRIGFRYHLPDAAALAVAFSGAAHCVATPDEMAAALIAVQLLEQPADDAVLGCFARMNQAARAAPADAIRRGAEAVFLQLTHLDPTILDTRPPLDVPWRESLRIAADWAARTAAAPALPAPPSTSAAAR